MSIDDFTPDELHLMCEYDPGTDTRSAMIAALMDVLDTLNPYEPDLAEMLEDIIGKLRMMTDREYLQMQRELSYYSDYSDFSYDYSDDSFDDEDSAYGGYDHDFYDESDEDGWYVNGFRVDMADMMEDLQED